MLKVYDLLITDVDLLANSINYEVMFPEYSKNIPRMSVSKIFQVDLQENWKFPEEIPRNIVKL